LTTNFVTDNIKGQTKERKFKLWCARRNIQVQDLTRRHLTYDFVVQILDRKFKVDVKSWTKPDKLVVEEFHDLTSQKPGWFHTSEADYIVYVNHDRLIWMNLEKARRIHNQIYRSYDLIKNRPTRGKYGDVWQSAFRYIPLHELKESLIELTLN